MYDYCNSVNVAEKYRAPSRESSGNSRKKLTLWSLAKEWGGIHSWSVGAYTCVIFQGVHTNFIGSQGGDAVFSADTEGFIPTIQK